MLVNFVKKIFRNKNDRLIGHYKKEIKKINALEAKYQALSDENLQKVFNSIKQLVQEAKNPESALIEALRH